MPLYSVDQLLGKTLVAKKAVPIFRFPVDGAEIIGEVKPGQVVGKIYSWLAPDPAKGRNTFFWAFYPVAGGGSYYYAPHEQGLYDISALDEQGILNVEQKIKQEAERLRQLNQPWYLSMLKTALPWIAAIAIAAAAVPTLLKPKK